MHFIIAANRTCQHPAVRTKTNAVDSTEMTQHGFFCPVADIPQTHLAASTATCERFAIRAETYMPDVTVMLQGRNFSPRRDVPYTHHVIGAAAGERSAIRTETGAQNMIPDSETPVKGGSWSPGGDIP